MAIKVTVLNSYDYNNYEFSKDCPDDSTLEEINQARKELQRLADEAIRQKQKMDNFNASKGNARNYLLRVKENLKELIAKTPDRSLFANEEAFERYKNGLAQEISQCEEKISELEDKINMDYNYEHDATFINWKIPERIG